MLMTMDKLEQETAINAAEPIRLLDGSLCNIPKWILVWNTWYGASLTDLPNTYRVKPLIDWNGVPLYAELAILEIVESNGWEGVWVDSFHRKFLDRMPGRNLSVDLPANVAEEIKLIRSIYRRLSAQYWDSKISRGEFGGTWDLLCWRGDQLLFIEAKRKFKDRLQQSQAAWLMATLACSKAASSFRIAEWTLKENAPQS
jgi:hypothetical protein